MTNVDKTHRFFKEKVYSNLAAFAFSPIGWAFKMENHGSITMPNFGKLFVAALLAPILVPATIVTSSIALCFAGVAALLKSYFPSLTMLQIKNNILLSAKYYGKTKQIIPGTENTTRFSDLSVTGGVVDLVEAVKLCEVEVGEK